MGVKFPGNNHYGGVRFNVSSVTKGWGEGVKFKKSITKVYGSTLLVLRGGRGEGRCAKFPEKNVRGSALRGGGCNIFGKKALRNARMAT